MAQRASPRDQQKKSAGTGAAGAAELHSSVTDSAKNSKSTVSSEKASSAAAAAKAAASSAATNAAAKSAAAAADAKAAASNLSAQTIASAAVGTAAANAIDNLAKEIAKVPTNIALNAGVANLEKSPTDQLAARVEKAVAAISEAKNTIDLSKVSAIEKVAATEKITDFVNKFADLSAISRYSIKPPSEKKSESYSVSNISQNFESGEPVKQTSTFKKHGKFEDNEIQVLSIAGFSPLYETDASGRGVKTSTGIALEHKWNATSIATNLSANLIQDIYDNNRYSFKTNIDKVRSTCRVSLSALVDSSSVVRTILVNIDDSIVSLNPKKFKKSATVAGIDDREKNLSFSSLLVDKGYNKKDIENIYSPTKLWLQSLLEVKKDLTGHTIALKKPDRPSEDKPTPTQLVNIVDETEKSWVNLYGTTGLAISDFVSLKDQDLLEKVKKTFSSLYKDLNKADSSSTSVLTSLGDKPDPMSIATIANILAKENVYSKYILKQENGDLKTLGFTRNVSGGNIGIFDYLVGRFPPDIYTFLSDTIDGSLSALSQRVERENAQTYNVLTFESSGDSKNTTLGSQYYVESVLKKNSVNNIGLDVARQLSLSRIFSDKSRVLNELKKCFVSKNLNSDTINMVKFDYLDQNSFFTAYDFGQYVSRNLEYVIRFHENSLVGIQKNNEPYYKVNGANPRIEIGVASSLAELLVIKSAVFPTDTFKDISQNLRSLLFCLVVKKCIEQHASTRSSGGDKEAITSAGSQEIAKQIFDLMVNSKSYVTVKDDKIVPPRINVAPQSLLSLNYSKIFTFQNSRETQGRSSPTFKEDGILKVWREIMQPFVSSLIVNTNAVRSVYSGSDYIYLLAAIFDMLLRSTAALVPGEAILYQEEVTQKSAAGGSSKSTARGLLLKIPDKTSIQTYYKIDTLGGVDQSNGITWQSEEDTPSVVLTSRHILKVLESLKSECDNMNMYLTTISEFLRDASIKLENLSNYASGPEVQSFLAREETVYNKDIALGQIDAKDVSDLVNLSLKRRQLTMRNYIVSEIKDRYYNSIETPEKQATSDFPAYSSLNKKQSNQDNEILRDFLPTNSVNLITYPSLVSYFSDIKFQTKQGNNLQILSAGICPAVLDEIFSSDFSLEDATRNFVTIKVHKVDHLYPEIIYSPKLYTFQVNRFPTRVMSLWPRLSMKAGRVLVDNFPTKVVLRDATVVITQGVKSSIVYSFPSTMSLAQVNRIYMNHVESYLAEEYLRWFTDVEMDDSRFYNFGQKFNSPRREQFTTYSQCLDSSAPSEVKLPSLTSRPLYDYFRENDTIMLAGDLTPSPDDEITRRASYPKKFDRVFHMFVDPDDFLVSPVMEQSPDLKRARDNLVTAGILVPIGNSFKRKDTSESDAALNEFTVSIAPWTNQTA